MNDTKELKGAEEIFQGLLTEAKAGRCIECQWCFPHKEWDNEFDSTEESHKVSRICLLQSDDHPNAGDQLLFSIAQLESEQYPERCSLGSFLEDNGTRIPECVAFSLNLDQVIMVMASGGDYRHEKIQPEIERHSMFMCRLSEALGLENDIKEKKLEKLLAILNGVTKEPLLN